MGAIQRWAHNKPIALAFISILVASSADACAEMFGAVKENRKVMKLFPLPPFEAWNNCYRNHRAILAFLRELLSTDPIGNTLLDFEQPVKDIQKADPAKLNKFWRRVPFATKQKIMKEIQIFVQEFWAGFLADVQNDLNTDIDDETYEKLLPLMHRPEAAFFIRVWAPCLIMHGCLPGKLYRQARLGNLEVMDKLLRLDSSLLHDPVIGKKIHNLRIQGKSAAYDKLLLAAQNPPKKKIDQRAVKANLSGLISAIAKLLHRRLTENQIRELFDAIAQDSGQGPLDNDLPESQEGFYQSYQRARKNWLPLLQ